MTTVSEVEPSDTNVSNFMRWAKPRTMLARYKQTPVEQTDKAILEKHPFAKIWEETVPYLFEYNTDYHNSLFYYTYYKTTNTLLKPSTNCCPIIWAFDSTGHKRN